MSDTPESGASDSDQGMSHYGSSADEPSSPAQTAPMTTEVPSGQSDAYGQPDAAGEAGAYGQAGEAGAYGQAGGYGQPGQTWPQAADLRPDSGPAPILVSFPPPTEQPRLTVAFRAILAIPQLFALAIVSAVAGVVAFIGWWAALFTGRLPDWAHQLLAGLVRWSARVSAYLYLVTGTYPPFTLDDTDYPVRLITKPTRLNPLAVLFRYFLMLPVGVVAAVASLGLAVLSVVAWVITVITGRVPTAMHEAFCAIIRFMARYSGYAYMVTPDYPGGLYGDRPEFALGSVPPGFAASQAAAVTDPLGTAAPEYAPTGASPAAVQAPQAPEAAGATGGPADPWRLVLSSRAKALVTASLVIGAAVLIAFIVLFVSLASPAVNSAVTRASALANINSAYGQLNGVLKTFPTQTEACGQSLSCVTALDGKVSRAFGTFGTNLQQAGVPSAYSGDEGKLAADTNAIAADFSRLAGAQSATQYEGIVAGMDITSTLDQWETDFNGLESALTRG